MQVTLVFPHQLFRLSDALAKHRDVILVEEWLFFKQYPFHKQKLVFHRATMQFYRHWLMQAGYNAEYIDCSKPYSDVRHLPAWLHKQHYTEIHYCDVTDDWLLRRLTAAARKANLKLVQYETPAFLNTLQQLDEYTAGKQRYFQTDFYIHQRQYRNVLLQNDGSPEGGKWSFDAENRLKLPRKEAVPRCNFPGAGKYVKEAVDYTNTYFSNNPGSLQPPFNTANGFYPVTFDEAQQWLDDFYISRFGKFGKYEDAIAQHKDVLYHSLLSPLLNVGLLTPQQVLDGALHAYKKHHLPLNSVEGFVRQIMGWREFMRMVYVAIGGKERTTNYWGFTRRIPQSFYTGNTGVGPVDAIIQKILKNAWCHHIERLMVLGNFMLLCEFTSDDVYHWFMVMFIDAYDWVMVANVYGMSQFADGGLMATKPYISGSNYLLKMSDFEKGEWQEIWDALFWRFLYKHKNYFEGNPRLGLLLKNWDNMDAARQKHHLHTAETFLHNL